MANARNSMDKNVRAGISSPVEDRNQQAAYGMYDWSPRPQQGMYDWTAAKARGMYEWTTSKAAPFIPQASVVNMVKSSGSINDPGSSYYLSPVTQAIILLSGAAAGYHGYKRNHNSVGWGFGWAALGAMFPLITLVVAYVEGYAKPAGRSARANPSRRSRRSRRRR